MSPGTVELCDAAKNCDEPTNDILAIKIIAEEWTGSYEVPALLPRPRGFPFDGLPAQTRILDLVEAEDDLDRLKLLINNRPFTIEASADLTPRFGTHEIWCFNNTTPDTHPMHIHLITFQVLHRSRTMNDTEPRIPPEDVETGPKDVVMAYPDMLTCVMTSVFDLRGSFMVHCHILEHEDWEMMQTYSVI